MLLWWKNDVGNLGVRICQIYDLGAYSNNDKLWQLFCVAEIANVWNVLSRVTTVVIFITKLL